MAPGISRWSAAKSSSVRTSIRAGIFAVPISRANLSEDIDVKDDMNAPSQKKRDAILGHVASWGDRRTPMGVLQRNRRGLSMRPSALRSGQELLELPLTQFLFARTCLNRPPRDQKQHQHDFAECGLVQAPVQFQTKTGAGEQRGQSDHEQF